jgi:glycosyltransferase involved in cell wall biosynthesis
MRIHYDGLVYAMQSVGGVSRYFNELLPRIAALNAAEGGRTTQSLRWGAHRPDLPGVAEIPTLLLPDHMGGGSWLKAAAYAVLRPLQNAWLDWRVGRPDIFHPTYYTTPWRKGIPTVVTVYDMIHERFPEYYGAPEHFRFRAAKAHAIRTADHVLCISEATRRDVIEILGIEPEKTTVTLLAGGGHTLTLGRTAASEFDAIPAAKPLVDPASPGNADSASLKEYLFCDGRVPGTPFILYVGSRRLYKNFDRMADAYLNAKGLEDLQLLVVGGESENRSERKHPVYSSTVPGKHFLETTYEETYEGRHVPSYHLGRVHRVVSVGRLSDSALAECYRNAAAVVVPSLYEGFGLPVLEALAQGAVVACSNTSSLPEVAGDCAFYFDPRDPDSIADALVKAVSLSGAERAAWAVRAKARAALFSWDKTAAATWEVYRRVAGK